MRRESLNKLIIVSLVIIAVLINPLVYIKAEDLDNPIEIIDENPFETVCCASCSLSISSGTATINTEINRINGTTLISATIYLEKLVNGSWQPYTSWSHSSGSDIISSDSTSVSSGAYRVWMHVSTSGSNGSESFDVNGNVAGC